MKVFIDKSIHYFAHWKIYVRAMAKWFGMAILTGTLCGVVGTCFHVGVEEATKFRGTHPWLLYLLPLAGLLIVGLYHFSHVEGQGTNNIIKEVQSGQGVSLRLLPAIFLSTFLTHLCGGSAGREGAALQMGGAIGYQSGRLLHLDDKDMRMATMIGMAAFFSALFGTPLGATVFAMEVISVGLIYHAAMVPCLLAALIAYEISLVCGVEPTRFTVTMPETGSILMIRIAVLAILCALVSVVFCELLHFIERQLEKYLKNLWIRAVVGGVLIIAMTLLSGTTDYNGAGMQVITAAVEEGQAFPAAFLLKILFTGITLGAGFKGGEVVPSFFVGATFGCVVGPLLGIPAGFAAAVGLVSVFCGATNCPLASIFLAVELFGAPGLLYFASACGLSYVFSGYDGLYSSQRILYSKLKAQYIDVHTNAHHAGEMTPGERKFP